MILKTSANAQQTILIFGKSSGSLLKNFVVKVQFIYSITNPTAISIITFFIRPPVKICADIWMVCFMVYVALFTLAYFESGSTTGGHCLEIIQCCLWSKYWCHKKRPSSYSDLIQTIGTHIEQNFESISK